MSNQNSKPKNKKTKKLNGKQRELRKSLPDGIGTTGAAQGEIDAGENTKLAAAIVSFELRDGGLLTGVLVLDVENGVVSRDGSNQERR